VAALPLAASGDGAVVMTALFGAGEGIAGDVAVSGDIELERMPAAVVGGSLAVAVPFAAATPSAPRPSTSAAAEVGGSRLVGANRAVIDPRKLTEYALNPSHPVGANKARVFEKLGFNQSNAGDLMQQLRSGVMQNTPIAGKVDQFGAWFTLDIPVTGPQASGVVRTGGSSSPAPVLSNSPRSS